jgi:hypothetical protein
MSHLKQKTLVACPLAQAKRRMEIFMTDNGSTSGSSLRTPFGFCLATHPSDTILRLEHEVTLSLVITSRITALEACWSVDWKSSDGGPFPEFVGELALENDDYKTFWLVLEGTYEPPLGIVGDAFDLLIGKRMASQSARELLARIASSMEAGFAADEAAKPHAQPLST